MPILDDCVDLDCIREYAAELLPELCTIYRLPDAAPYEGEDAVVLYPTGWTVVATDIPCRLDSSRGRASERPEVAGVKATNEFVLHLDYDTASPLTIPKTARVRVTTKNNRDFEIRGIPDSSDQVTRILEVDERT